MIKRVVSFLLSVDGVVVDDSVHGDVVCDVTVLWIVVGLVGLTRL